MRIAFFMVAGVGLEKVRRYGTLTNASRLLARLRCPKCADLALARRISTAALAYRSLYRPPDALANATQRATLVGLITRSRAGNSPRNKEKTQPADADCVFYGCGGGT